MNKSFVKELQGELDAMRAGKSQIERYTGREVHESKGVAVRVSKATYARLSRLAKEKNVPIGTLIAQLVNKGS